MPQNVSEIMINDPICNLRDVKPPMHHNLSEVGDILCPVFELFEMKNTFIFIIFLPMRDNEWMWFSSFVSG